MIPWIILGHPGVAPHPYALHARAFNRRTECEPVRSGCVPPVHVVAGNVPPRGAGTLRGNLAGRQATDSAAAEASPRMGRHSYTPIGSYKGWTRRVLPLPRGMGLRAAQTM
jgi:hypothetical protein